IAVSSDRNEPTIRPRTPNTAPDDTALFVPVRGPNSPIGMRISAPTTTPVTVAATACHQDSPSTTGNAPRMIVANVLAPPNWIRKRSSGRADRSPAGMVSMPWTSTCVARGGATTAGAAGPVPGTPAGMELGLLMLTVLVEGPLRVRAEWPSGKVNAKLLGTQHSSPTRRWHADPADRRPVRPRGPCDAGLPRGPGAATAGALHHRPRRVQPAPPRHGLADRHARGRAVPLRGRRGESRRAGPRAVRGAGRRGRRARARAADPHRLGPRGAAGWPAARRRAASDPHRV